MHIVAFVTQKGGAGKSTLASNLAVAAHLAGERVFICDLDPLQSLVKWSRLRKAVDIPVEHIPAHKLELALHSLGRDGVTVAVIDTPGAHSEGSLRAVRVADFCIVPARPNILDIWASEETVATIKAARKDFAFLLNQCPPAQQSGRVARGAQVLQELGALLAPMISTRVDYQEAVLLGLGACELRPRGAAAREMATLWAGVKTRLEERERQRLDDRVIASNPVLASYREIFDQAARVGDLYTDFFRAMLPLAQQRPGRAAGDEEEEETVRPRRRS
ncbi:ParA family protein [Methylocystis echinoides]|uniref:ParA family protein n=1 Tax=Methylocystis echinoides TaxID=29468 RepID=UPI003438D1EC